MKKIYNIYLIERKDEKSTLHAWDVFLGAVVIAESVGIARLIHPSGSNATEEMLDDTWVDPEDVKVTKIGETDLSNTQIILSSFKSG